MFRGNARDLYYQTHLTGGMTAVSAMMILQLEESRVSFERRCKDSRPSILVAISICSLDLCFLFRYATQACQVQCYRAGERITEPDCQGDEGRAGNNITAKKKIYIYIYSVRGPFVRR